MQRMIHFLRWERLTTIRAASCVMVRAPADRLSLYDRVSLFFVLLATLVPPAAAWAAPANPHGLAVIIGNRSYTHGDVPPVDYAHRDAAAFKRYVVDVLGYDPGQRHPH